MPNRCGRRRPGGRSALVTALLAGALAATLGLTACSGPSAAPAAAVPAGSTVKVGLLDSLSGPTAITEVTIRDALDLAIDEINARGGVLGRRIVPIGADGGSAPATFTRKAQQLLDADHVSVIFGGWTPASRQALTPVLEKDRALLFYPGQDDGLPASPAVVTTGATLNQQLVPALAYLRRTGAKRVYLLAGDDAFGQRAGEVVAAYAKAHGLEVAGSDHLPPGDTALGPVLATLRSRRPDAVLNLLADDSDTAFWRRYAAAGLSPGRLPVLSLPVGPDETAAIGPAHLAGQLVARSYLMTTPGTVNSRFVAAYRAKYGAGKAISDPVEAAYVSVYLWKALVEKARSFDPAKLRAAAAGVTVAAPEGRVTIDGPTLHVYRTARIGRIGAHGQVTAAWTSAAPVAPDPALTEYSWARALH